MSEARSGAPTMRACGAQLRRALLLLLTSSGLGLAGCSSIPVTTDYDPDFSFSGLRTYALLAPASRNDPDPRVSNPLVHQRIRRALHEQLQARGFRQVDAADADFLVNHHIGIETGFDVRTVHSAHGYGRAGWRGSSVGHTVVNEYERGTLLIDVLVPSERRLVWRGSASARTRPNASPEQRDERVNEAVSNILDRFPPS